MSEKTSSTGAPAGAEAPPAVPARWSAGRKTEVVLRLLRGEPVDMVARETQVPAHALEAWRRVFLTTGTHGLKKQGDPEAREVRRLQAKLGEVMMRLELAPRCLDNVVKPALLIPTPGGLLQVYWTRLDFTLLLDNLVADDTFLYLQIVRNIADHGVVSFDGIHTTTGLQPLWAILLVPLAIAIEDRVEFVRWVLALSVFLNLAAGLVLVRLAGSLGGRSSELITACLWPATCSRPGRR